MNKGTEPTKIPILSVYNYEQRIIDIDLMSPLK